MAGFIDDQPSETPKVGCIFTVAISFEFRMGQYRYDDHQEDAPHFEKGFRLDGRKYKTIELAISHHQPYWDRN